MKPTSSAERTLTFAPDMNGRHDPEAKRLLLLVARKAKIPQISIGTFSRHFGSIVDEANQIRITTRRISSNDINLAFDRITKSVQQLHSRLLALESCTDFNSWPAPGSEDTELGVLMELEVGHGETEVYPRVQA
jgi:hypothetical protein